MGLIGELLANYCSLDSSVSKASTNSIVDASAYLLFYRRRSDVPLGGPRFREILDRFQDEPSDTEFSGEGQRLGEVSSLGGSSSAFQGVGATHLDGSLGGSNANNSFVLNRTGNTKTDDDVPLLVGSRYDSTQGVHQSIEEDEGIDMGESASHSTGFHPITGDNTWSFHNLSGAGDFTAGSGSANVSEIASDEAQHDSSGDERALSHHNMEYEPDVELDMSGFSSYQLAPQPESDPPSYKEPLEPQVKYLGTLAARETNGQWDQNQEVYQVTAIQTDDERRSEEATEIHLDESDKIKLG